MISKTRAHKARLAAGATVGIALLGQGCIIAPIVENYKRTSTHTIKAKYEKLRDKTFAVVISASRGIESEQPGVTDAMMERISLRLAQPESKVEASGVTPPKIVAKTLYNRPAWQAMTYEEVAKLLGGVDRLIFIELEEFRLSDAGNRYEWAGAASGRVMVIEADGYDPNAVAFEELVRVRFPDKSGFTPDTLTAQAVASTLLSRFVDRASWLFYDHEEPYYPEY